MSHRAVLASAWRVADACMARPRWSASRRSGHVPRHPTYRRVVSETTETLDASQYFDTLRHHYATEGWVVVRAVAAPTLIDALQLATDALEHEASTFTHSKRSGGVFFETQSVSGRKSDPAAEKGLLRKVGAPSKRHTAFRDLVGLERIHTVAREVCGVVGSGMTCAVDQVNMKPPGGAGSGFPWHQDLSFLKPKALTSFNTHGGVNVVVALDRSSSINGGFEVLGRTHVSCSEETSKILRNTYDGVTESAEKLNLFDETFRVCPDLKPGDAVFFHPKLAHGSARNNSDQRRRIATLWYVGG